ncbi:MAG: recombinase family protein [Candidatus Omnitrophica bacterium]|nr:recombinase family protein [Candidatus Omnitrophota bacterium]
MKCAVYVRVSTEEQAKEGYSLAAQTDKIVEYIKNKGWTYSEVYCDDGYTASNRRRPALEKMLDDATAKQFEAVLVYRIDRLSRNLKDLIEIVEELAKNGAGFKSITELIDTTTPEGRLMFHQFGSFAQYERELIAQRTALGLEKRLKLGLWPSGVAPFGYTLKEGKLQITEKEAKIVRLMFDLYLNKNYGVVNIARYLNGLNIKTRRGNKWRFTVVYHILTNPTYIGVNVRGGERVTGAHKPIIKEEVFNKIKEIFPTRKAKTRSFVSPNLFTGFIFCGCGSPMHVTYGGPPKDKYKYYVCARRLTYKDCKTEILRTDVLENSVINQIKLIAEDKPRLQTIINNLKQENTELLPGLKREQQKIVHKVDALTKEKNGLLKWMSEKDAKPYTLNVLNEKFEKIELELNDLTHSRWQIEEELKKRLHFGLSSEKVSQYLKQVVETFTRLDRQEKKRALLEVIQKIKVNSKDEVHLFLGLPCRISALPPGEEPLGSTLQYSALRLRNTQKAICQLTYSLKDYYNNNHKSI